MVRYPSPTLGSLPLPISLRSLSPILAATFMPPRGRPTLVVLSLVTSSSDALFSSASSSRTSREAVGNPHYFLAEAAVLSAFGRPARSAPCAPIE